MKTIMVKKTVSKKANTKIVHRHERFVKRVKKLSPGKVVLIALIGLGLLAALFFSPFPTSGVKTESVAYTTQTQQSATLELGQTQVQQPGANGMQQVSYDTNVSLFDRLFHKSTKEQVTSTKVIKAATPKIVLNGTTKYQYMYCSNGQSRYYTDDQFKSPTVGFTHQSADDCAKNNEGHEIGIGSTLSGRPSATKTAANTACTNITIPYTTTYQYNDALASGQRYTTGVGINGFSIACGTEAPLTIPPSNEVVEIGTGVDAANAAQQQALQEQQAAENEAYQKQAALEKCAQQYQSALAQLEALGAADGSGLEMIQSMARQCQNQANAI